MRDLGISARRIWRFPSYSQLFLLDAGEAQALNEALQSNPVKLQKSGSHANISGLVPGTLPGNILDEVDLGELTRFSRDKADSWQVSYAVEGKRDPTRLLMKGERSFYTKLDFELAKSAEGRTLEVTSTLNLSWSPKDKDYFGPNNDRDRAFHDILIEYFVLGWDSEKKLVSPHGNDFNGISFAPIQAARGVMSELEKITDVVLEADLLRLGALLQTSQVISALPNYNEHMGYSRDFAQQGLTAEYHRGIKEIARKISRVPDRVVRVPVAV